jgi:hypothetical protein
MNRRLPAAAAVVFAVLYAAALLMVPPLPGIEKPGDAVVSHLRDHTGPIRLQALMVTLGSLALVIVLGYARTKLDGPGGYVFTRTLSMNCGSLLILNVST